MVEERGKRRVLAIGARWRAGEASQHGLERCSDLEALTEKRGWGERRKTHERRSRAFFPSLVTDQYEVECHLSRREGTLGNRPDVLRP